MTAPFPALATPQTVEYPLSAPVAVVRAGISLHRALVRAVSLALEMRRACCIAACDGPCCPDATIVTVEAFSPAVALGVTSPPALGSRADWERLGLVAETASLVVIEARRDADLCSEAELATMPPALLQEEAA